MNKKKMMLGVILLIVVIGFLGVKLLNSTQIATEEIIAEENATNEIQEENTIIEEIAMEDTTDNEQAENVVDIPQLEENSNQIQQTKTQESTTPKETTKTVSKTKAQTQEQPQVEQQAQPQTMLVAQEIQPEMKATTELQIKTEEKPSTPTPVASNPVQETKDTAQENTYVYNAEMTQRIVDVINSNPSQFMQEYGYTVTIDSSITSLTNQFTFFENRVIEKIQNKAGNIRVYAQDYYYYGEYLFTECYII